jgi:hypothetical protein
MVVPMFGISVLMTIQHAPGARYQIILATYAVICLLPLQLLRETLNDESDPLSKIRR